MDINRTSLQVYNDAEVSLRPDGRRVEIRELAGIGRSFAEAGTV